MGNIRICRGSRIRIIAFRNLKKDIYCESGFSSESNFFVNSDFIFVNSYLIELLLILSHCKHSGKLCKTMRTMRQLKISYLWLFENI